MADVQDIRAQLREARHQPAAPSGNDGGLRFYLMAAMAAVVGFGIVLFTPKVFSVQRTASLPNFHESASREAVAPAQTVVMAPVAPAAPAAAGAPPYAGKSADEMAGMADAVCAGRSSRPAGLPAPQNVSLNADTIPHENDKLHCFLSEAPARFCAAGQARKATADVINYFKGIEYANAATAIAAKLTGAPARLPGVESAPPGAKLAPDPRVIVAVEGLMKTGYLSRAQREEIGANVPPEIKHRLALVVANASPCPKPPWWAVWK
jgi:hypothetical protein